MTRTVTIGTLGEVPKLGKNGKPLMVPKRGEDGEPIFDEPCSVQMRGVGQRIVHSLVLEKVINLMNQLGEQDAMLAARRWRDGPGKVAGPTALAQALKHANAHRQTFMEKDMPREAAYCELAAFCLQSCIDETGAA